MLPGLAPEGLRAAGMAALLLAVLMLGWKSLGQSTLSRADFAFCNQDEVTSLDPALASGFPEGRVVSALFEGLTRLDPNTLEPLPAGATSWCCSSDGLTWTFLLRAEARWSNGDPVTAEDYRWSLLRLLDPATGSGSAYLLDAVRGARAAAATPLGQALRPESVGIRAPAALRLVITLEHPSPNLPRLLANHLLSPVHRPSLEAWGREWVQPGKLVCNGPFRLLERRLKDRIRLVRNESYWGTDDVGLDTIDAYAVNGVTTQLNLFLTQEVDWMIKPPAGLYDELLDRPEARVGPQFGTTFLRFNVRRPLLADPDLRRALALALDREQLASEVMRGGRHAARSFVPPGLSDYQPARFPPGDPERARQLLARAGFPAGRGLPALELLYPHNQATRDLCQALAETWRRELGVQTRLVVQSWKVYIDSTRQGLYDVAWSSWIGDWLDPGTFLAVFLSGSGTNRTGWTDSRYDELVERALQTPEPGPRAALWQAAEQRLLDQTPIVPLIQRVNINLVSKRVVGFHDNLLDLHLLRDLSVTGPPP